MNTLLQSALLGTGQHDDLSRERADSPADSLVDAVGPESRERTLLLRAGAHAVLRRAAGIFPERAPVTDCAAADGKPPISPRLAEILAELLAKHANEPLREALRESAARGLRLPHALLPLALAQTSPERRELLKPLLGERGRWLAKQRAEWSWASAAREELGPEAIAQRWNEDGAEERKALWLLLRRTQPDTARQLLAETLKHEKPERRLAYLELLGRDPSQADAPLLSSLLSDRSLPVRALVAQLMWRLPETEIAQRMRARSEALIAYTKRDGFRVTLPPEPLDPEWERDGITSLPQGSGLGPRQGWLMQLLSAIPPQALCARFHAEPDELVQATRTHEYDRALAVGLTRAALRFESRAFFAPLFHLWLDEPFPDIEGSALAELTRRLTPLEFEPVVLAALSRDHRTPLLTFLPRPWPESVARAFLRALARAPRVWGPSLAAATHAIPAALLPRELPAPPLDDGRNESELAYFFAQFQAIAALRRTIAEELAP